MSVHIPGVFRVGLLLAPGGRPWGACPSLATRSMNKPPVGSEKWSWLPPDCLRANLTAKRADAGGKCGL
jgi:hypothetical protein